jgi:hypothetical protein
MYRPLVRRGGLIGFHDICAWDVKSYGVPRLWNEIKDESAVEIIDEDDLGPHNAWPTGIGFGIGVLIT